jgi:hypothetical protein
MKSKAIEHQFRNGDKSLLMDGGIFSKSAPKMLFTAK